MRKKQLFALLMAGALSVGMAPTATFAADTAAETSAEGELEGELELCRYRRNLLKTRLKLLGNQPKIQPRHRKIRLKLLQKQQLIRQRHRLLEETDEQAAEARICDCDWRRFLYFSGRSVRSSTRL